MYRFWAEINTDMDWGWNGKILYHEKHEKFYQTINEAYRGLLFYIE